MKTLPSALTPFVRSDLSGALLAETLGRSDKEFSLADLGRLTNAGPGVIHKEVGRLVAAGVLRDRVIGRNRMVRANVEHLLFALMRDIIASTYGPVPILREALSVVPGVEAAYIYGSWAARRAGESGEYPRDIDVLIVGDASRRALSEAARAVSDRIGVDVNVARVSRADWDAEPPAPFLLTVRERPIFNLVGGVDG